MAPTDKNPVANEDKKKDIKKPITSHSLVPLHRILSAEEKKSLLEKYGIKLKQLPKISIKDPVVKLLEDAKIGDVLLIERSSVTAGKTNYYRVII